MTETTLNNDALTWIRSQVRIKELEAEIAQLKEDQASVLPGLRESYTYGQRFDIFGKTWEFIEDPRGSVSYKAALDAFKEVADDEHLVLIDHLVGKNTKASKPYPKFKAL